MAVVYTSPNASDPNVALQAEITALAAVIATNSFPAGQQSKIQLLKQKQDQLAINLMNIERIPAASIISTLNIKSPTELSGRITAAANNPGANPQLEQAHLQKQAVAEAIAHGQVNGAQILATMT